MLCASVDDQQVRNPPIFLLRNLSINSKQTEDSLSEIKSQIKMVLRRLNRNSEPQASIESGAYTLQYVVYLSWSSEVFGIASGGDHRMYALQTLQLDLTGGRSFYQKSGNHMELETEAVCHSSTATLPESCQPFQNNTIAKRLPLAGKLLVLEEI